jgi:hypothetical protein
MAATVTVRRWTGASGAPTKTDVTSSTTRASTSDAPTPGTANPIPIPGAGTKYSYWISTRLQATTSPTGTINNLRWFSDGSNNYGTGVTAKGQSATSYVEAGGTPGDSGTQLTTGNHGGLSAAPVDVFGFTSASPKALAGSISNPSTGDFGDFFVMQLEVASTAGPGTLTAETFTFRYDET